MARMADQTCSPHSIAAPMPARSSRPKRPGLMDAQKPGTPEWVILTALVLAYCVSGVSSVRFHPDESQWIASSNVLEEYFSGRFSSPLWDESYWTLTQPPLARYVIGMGRRAGGYGGDDLVEPWDWGHDDAWNIQAGAMPSERLLWWSRLPMAILMAFSVMVVYTLLRMGFGLPASLVWIALVLTNDFFGLTLRRAMGESSLLAGIMLVLLACYGVLQASDINSPHGDRRVYWWIALAGAGTGLAGSAKLNGLSTAAAGLGVVILRATRAARDWKTRGRCVVIDSGLLFVCAVGTFVLVNPYLWPDPVARSLRMLDHRFYEMGVQVRVFPDSAIGGFSDHVRTLFVRVFQDYGGVPHVNALLVLAASLTGWGFILSVALGWLRGRGGSPSVVAVALVALSASVPALFTPLDWDRYYLLPIWFSTLGVAVLLGRGVLAVIGAARMCRARSR